MTIDIDLTVRVAVTYNPSEDRLWSAIIADGTDILPALSESQRAILQHIALAEDEPEVAPLMADRIRDNVASFDEHQVVFLYDMFSGRTKIATELFRELVSRARDELVL